MLVLVCSGAVLVAGEPHIIKQTPLPRILLNGLIRVHTKSQLYERLSTNFPSMDLFGTFSGQNTPKHIYFCQPRQDFGASPLPPNQKESQAVLCSQTTHTQR